MAAGFVLALGLSLALTPLCRHLARRLGFVETPRADRWHHQPTAVFGGVAIVVTTLAIAVALQPNFRLIELMACGIIMSAFGLADDLVTFKPYTKLIAQITVASVLLFFGYRLHWMHSLLGDAMLTLFWIVGITNAFNLLDNMDGLCAGTALVAGAFLLVTFTEDAADAGRGVYLATMLGATAGFLVYNIHPASIFMGDAGSLFLGFNVAAITLLAGSGAREGSGLVSVVVAPVLLLLIPIVDTTLVTTMRLLSGRRPSQGGRDHVSHRLVAIGLSESRAVATLWMLGAVGGTASLLLQRRDQSWTIILAVILLLATVIFSVYLARVRTYEDPSAVASGEAVTPLVSTFMHKRRVAEVLLDACLIPLAYYTAYRLRFEGEQFSVNYPLFLRSLPVVLAMQLLSLFVVGGYRGTWRYFGMMDAVVFAKAVALGTVAAQTIILYTYRFRSYSRAVFVIDALLLVVLLAGSRASFRLLSEFVLRRRAAGQRCVIYGTDGASLTTIREAFGEGVALKIVGFVDDDPTRHRLRVGGYSVLGDFPSLVDMIERDEVDCVVLNTHLVDASRLQQLEEACRTRSIDLLRLQIHLRRLSAVS